MLAKADRALRGKLRRHVALGRRRFPERGAARRTAIRICGRSAQPGSIRPGEDTPMMRVVRTRRPVQLADLRDSRGYLSREPLWWRASMSPEFVP